VCPSLRDLQLVRGTGIAGARSLASEGELALGVQELLARRTETNHDIDILSHQR
jgi:hypothetical protein